MRKVRRDKFGLFVVQDGVKENDMDREAKHLLIWGCFVMLFNFLVMILQLVLGEWWNLLLAVINGGCVVFMANSLANLLDLEYAVRQLYARYERR